MGKNCNKSCDTSCSVSVSCPKSESDCCKCTEVSDCCTSQFKRLQLLLSHWSAVAMGNSELHSVLMVDQSGNHDHTYSGTTSSNGDHTHTFSDGTGDGVASGTTSTNGAHSHTYSGTVSTNGLHRHTFTRLVRNPVTRDGAVVNVPSSINTDTNAITAFNFIWSHRNLLIEKCGKNQVWGWVVDFSDGDLELLQDMDGVSWETSKTRQEIYDTACNDLTIADKKAKSVLDRLYSMSQEVVRCNKYPDTEGNVVEVTDRCGQKWLVAVNLARPSSNTGYGSDADSDSDGEEANENSTVFSRAETGKYVMVACKL